MYQEHLSALHSVGHFLRKIRGAVESVSPVPISIELLGAEGAEHIAQSTLWCSEFTSRNQYVLRIVTGVFTRALKWIFSLACLQLQKTYCPTCQACFQEPAVPWLEFVSCVGNQASFLPAKAVLLPFGLSCGTCHLTSLRSFVESKITGLKKSCLIASLRLEEVGKGWPQVLISTRTGFFLCF